ncbi:MAG: molybdopterin oxidoreductase family protein [Chloroflexi bacterium]|nr:molybdopterin oxidoreductase family protein [Chloroflexota bacterium]
MFMIITGVCPHDCPDTCSWQVKVDPIDGRALDIWGHPDHPVTQGRLCGKVDRYLERTYHPDRLTAPLKRVGRKGEGRFQTIGWDQAIAEITDRLKAIIAEYGAEAVLPYSYAGTMGVLQGEGMAARFFNRMGASQLARTICSEAGFEGYQYTTGRVIGMEPQDFAHARLILLWGTNTLTSNMHLWPFVQQARKKGARVIVIDPARTRTARAADEWIPIWPGTDAALALAMMQALIAEDRIDHEYIAKATVGFEKLVERVRQFPPEWAESITGIPAERIRELARVYAETQPAAIRVNYGLQRHAGGGMAMRNIVILPALVGAWRYRGGGVQLSSSGSFYLDKSALKRPDLLGDRHPRTINMIRLGDALSLDPTRLARAHYHPRPIDPIPSPEEAGPPVKALIVYNSNPAAVAPDQAAVTAGLLREDLFTVVLEHFQTDTADYADYVLPATTQLEHWDILKPYGHLFLALNRPAIAPIGQALPNSEIFRRLAAGMGYEDPCFREDDETILRNFIQAQTHPTFEGVTWKRLLAEGFVRLNLPEPYLPFAEGHFPTPSGKCELFSQRMADDGYDPLPAWIPPAAFKSRTQNPQRLDDSRSSCETSAFEHPPLMLISPPAHSFLNTTFANMARFQAREIEPMVWLHPQDAAERGVIDRDVVCICNEQGRVQLVARVTEDIMPGVALAPTIWWRKFSPDERNVNWLTDQHETDMGGTAAFYDVRVWLTKG